MAMLGAALWLLAGAVARRAAATRALPRLLLRRARPVRPARLPRARSRLGRHRSRPAAVGDLRRHAHRRRGDDGPRRLARRWRCSRRSTPGCWCCSCSSCAACAIGGGMTPGDAAGAGHVRGAGRLRRARRRRFRRRHLGPAGPRRAARRASRRAGPCDRAGVGSEPRLADLRGRAAVHLLSRRLRAGQRRAVLAAPLRADRHRAARRRVRVPRLRRDQRRDARRLGRRLRRLERADADPARHVPRRAVDRRSVSLVRSVPGRHRRPGAADLRLSRRGLPGLGIARRRRCATTSAGARSSSGGWPAPRRSSCWCWRDPRRRGSGAG